MAAISVNSPTYVAKGHHLLIFKKIKEPFKIPPFPYYLNWQHASLQSFRKSFT